MKNCILNVMEMKLRLKDEICFTFHKEGIEVYSGNKQLNTLIKTDDNRTFFDFLTFLTKARSNNEIEEYGASKEVKNDIINFLIKNQYVVWEDRNREFYSRNELFINTFPKTNYSDFKDKISSINILLIGLGSAGSYVLEVLSKLEFNSFYLIDGDKVCNENLQSQFFSKKDLGKYKAEVIRNKYPDCKIDYENKFINNLDDLNRILLNKTFNYIINCADDFMLTKNLLTLIKSDRYQFALIESGYGPLLQQSYFINSKYKAEKLLKDINYLQRKNKEKEILAKNSGSIFNSWLSAFSIGKIIFDNILGFDHSEFAEFDLLQNRYFLGNSYNKIYFDNYSKLIQSNMKYKFNSNYSRFKNKITKENIFDLQNEYFKYDEKFDHYIKEFLCSKYKVDDFIIYEDKIEILSSLELDLNTMLEQQILTEFINYIKENFEIDINKLDYIINNNIIENSHKNSLKQNLIKKVGDDYIIFVQNYSNEFEKIIYKIHELFHYIYYQISESDYEHENFVMTNEIKFYNNLYSKNIALFNFVVFYFINLLKNHLYNFIALDYEKGFYQKDFETFKKNHNSLISNDLPAMIVILNNKTVFNKPFYTLKYFRAFNNNRMLIHMILDKLCKNIKEKINV